MPIGHAFRVMVAGALLASASTAPGAAAQRELSPDEAAVRAARAESNKAIAAHDVAGIARHWMSDVHIVTSTGVQGTGREANSQRMAQQFERRHDTIYVRTPTAVDVLPAWAVASERGEWTGRWTEPDGVVQVSGTYLAQWRRVNGRWLLQAELFVPTACQGSRYCDTHP